MRRTTILTAILMAAVVMALMAMSSMMSSFNRRLTEAENRIEMYHSNERPNP